MVLRLVSLRTQNSSPVQLWRGPSLVGPQVMLSLLAPADHTLRVQKAVSGGQQALPDTGCLPPTPLPPSCALLSLAAGSDHVRRRGRPTSLPQVPAPPGPACLPLAPSHHSCWFSPVGSLKSSTWTRTRVRCAGQTCPWEGWLTVGVGKGVLLLLMTFHGAGQARGRQIFRATRFLCSWPILMNF